MAKSFPEIYRRLYHRGLLHRADQLLHPLHKQVGLIITSCFNSTDALFDDGEPYLIQLCTYKKKKGLNSFKAPLQLRLSLKIRLDLIIKLELLRQNCKYPEIGRIHHFL